MQSRRDRKNRTCESSPGGSGPCFNIRCPSHPHRVHGFTGCVDALLKEHSSGGGASSAAGAARGAGMPGLGGITSMFSGLARGLQRSQQPQGPPEGRDGDPAAFLAPRRGHEEVERTSTPADAAGTSITVRNPPLVLDERSQPRPVNLQPVVTETRAPRLVRRTNVAPTGSSSILSALRLRCFSPAGMHSQ
jgi:hypothetical protein